MRSFTGWAHAALSSYRGNPIRDILYATSTATDQVIAFDTNTWQELYRFNVGEDWRGNSSFDDPSKPLGNGVMTISNDGRYLFLSTVMGVRMFNLGATTGNNTRNHTISLLTGKTVTGITFAAQQIPAFSISDVTLTEGDNGITNAVFTVTLNRSVTQTITVNYATSDATAIAGLDYTATNGTLTFTPGETSKTIRVDILSDTQFEVNETVFVNLSSPDGAGLLDNRGVGTIVNDDPTPPVLAITDATVIEENDSNFAAFTVVLSTATPQPVTVNYATSNGTAIAGSDYITTSGTLTFAPNETLKVILVPIVGDTVSEPDEAFFVNLSNSSNAIIGDISGFGIIRNDDVA